MKSTNILIFGIVLSGVILLNAACVSEKSAARETSKVSSEIAPNTTNAVDGRIAEAEKAIEKFPEIANGYTNLAVAFIQKARETGDFDLNTKAENAVKKALEIEPENLTAQKIQTSLHLTFHRFAEAREIAANLLKNNDKDAFLYGALTDANVELGNYPEAVEAVQKMVDLRPNMESYARVAHVRSLYGDSDGAIEAMTLASKIADPKDKEAQAWCLVKLGDEYFQIGKFAEAEKNYDSALEILPNFYLALAAKGKSRAAAKDFEAAQKFYQQVNQKVPNTENVIQLGNVYTKLGNVEKAKQQYDLAVFMEEKFGNTDQRRLALLWADQDIKLDEALEIAKREHATRKDIYTADILAWCFYKKGMLKEAKATISEAMKLKTKDARILYHAGMIEKGLGNTKEAKIFLNKALELNPAFDILQAETVKTVVVDLN